MRDMAPNLTDYEKTYREFKWEIPEYYNFGFDGIDRWAEDRTKLALLSVDDTGIHAVRHTFYDLMRLSNQFANVLLNLGIKKGDRVLLMLPRIPEWYVAMIGMIKLGVIPMPTSILVTAEDIRFRGIPDEKGREIIKAFISLRSSFEPSERLSWEILEHARRSLEARRVPRELEFLRELPKTTTGKIKRSELKNREMEKRRLQR